MNICTRCGKTASVSEKGQCQECESGSQYSIVAQFQLKIAFQFTGRPFFLQGIISQGEIQAGNYIDLKKAGLDLYPKIESVQVVRIRTKNGAIWETALFINNLTEEQKKHLKEIAMEEVILLDILV